jgi:hypothetical protein
MTDQPKVCPDCGGVGKIRISDDTWKRCFCSFTRVWKSRVGPEITAARRISSTPLYIQGPDGKPLVDRTRDNLIITGWWKDILAHLRYILLYKHAEFDLRYCLRITTDERLKSVYLGSESYKAKKAKDRDMDNVASYNSLSDYIGPDLHLVLIQLGILGYPNKAMPGILKETLLIRQAANLPTWLVVSPDQPFQPGHFAYSDDVQEYIGRTYEVVDLTVLREGQVVTKRNPTAEMFSSEPGMSSDKDDVLDDNQEEPKPQVARPRSNRPPQPPPEDAGGVDDFLSPERGNKKGKHNKGSGGRFNGGKGGNGGSPL